MSLKASSSLWFQYLKIVAVVLFYWAISILMVFLNKYVFSDKKEFNLDAPLFITFFQCLCSIAVTLLFSLVDRLAKPTCLRLIDFPERFTFSTHIARKTLPLTLVFVSMIVFNNLCLKYVQVAFYFVSRSLTTVFNVIFVFLILHQRTSLNVILSCLTMIAGFLLGVDQENRDQTADQNHLNYFGIFFGLLSSIFVSLNAIYAKKVLANMDNNVWLLNLYNNLNSIFIFVPLILLSGELHILFDYPNYSLRFLNIMLLSGLFGFLIQFSSALQIKLTSPLTHNISGTVKSCLQTGIAVVYFQQAKSLLWWLSNLLVIVGSLIYTRLRQIEMKQNFANDQRPAGDDVKPLLTNVKTC